MLHLEWKIQLNKLINQLVALVEQRAFLLKIFPNMEN
jgi:hypothetical protein